MRTIALPLLVAGFVLSGTSAPHAQSPDPSGHWEGTITSPTGQTSSFAVDLVRDDRGELAGTIDLPGDQIHGLPLREVLANGTSLTLVARSDQPVVGTLSADGQSFSGDIDVQGFSIPVTMSRTGEGRVSRVPLSAPVDGQLEGRWTAALDSGPATLRVELTIANQAGGSKGTLVNLDEGDLTMPLSSIRQEGSRVTLELASVGGSFSGALNADHTRLTGTYTERQRAVPLTFTRAERK